MIKLEHFNEKIREINTDSYLKKLLTKVNNGEGYLSIDSDNIVKFNNFSKRITKNEIDEFLKIKSEEKTSFSL